MGANEKPEQVARSEERFNQRLLYRAYDLILSWPVVETAVSEAGEGETPQGKPPEANQQQGNHPPI